MVSAVSLRPVGITMIAFPPPADSDVRSRTVCLTMCSVGRSLSTFSSEVTSSRSLVWLP